MPSVIMTRCTKEDDSSPSTEEIINTRVKALETMVEERMAENNEVFESLVRSQDNLENVIVSNNEDTRNVIESVKQDMIKNIDNGFLKNKKEFDKLFKENDSKIEHCFLKLSEHMGGMETFIHQEKERLNKSIEMCGMMASDMDMMIEKRESTIKNKINEFEEKMEEAMKAMDIIQDKIHEFDMNKKNNLIFHGIVQEENETKRILEKKVRTIIQMLKVNAELALASVNRLHTGSDILGCRPVLVTFKNVKDKQEVLASSKHVSTTPVTVAEDVSKNTKEARQQLRKFMRLTKKNNPEKRCDLEYDKLYVDDAVFIFDEAKKQVVEQKYFDPRQSFNRR